MTKASDNVFPRFLMSEGGSTSTPAAGRVTVYAKADGLIYSKDDAGTEKLLSSGPASGVSSGTANPGSPADGDLFYRTDLDLLIRYRSTGTRWVTTTLFRETFGIGNVLAPDTSSGAAIGRLAPWSTAYDLWLENWDASTYVATTNNGTSHWSVTLYKVDAADSPTSIDSFLTNGDTVNNWTQRRRSIGASYVASSFRGFRVQSAKVSTPGGLFWAISLEYRLIVT